jgi:prepilin-type N-terminal cleavage/methylation domain-containing protein/prepilin-type processing-associated H-X9-DG protein
MHNLNRKRNVSAYTGRGAGFTLIEMLIVIAIISILAAILFPVFARARESARRASCQSNQKQIALGLTMYTQDFDERYPMTWYGLNHPETVAKAGEPVSAYFFTDVGGVRSDAGNYNYSWMDFIYPYVKNIQLFNCPSNTTPRESGRLVPNYWLNPAFGNASNANGTTFASSLYGNLIAHITGISTAAVERPSTTVMLGEIGNGASNSYPKYLFTASAPGYIHETRELFEMHSQGMNVAYADGHVKWMSIATLRAQTGSDRSNNCNLNAIAESRTYCSKLWNPFRP